MRALPLAARIYVATVIAAGAVLFALLAPRATFSHPVLFVVLLCLSGLSSSFKVHLPLTKGGSTMSVSYAVDVAALLAYLQAHDGHASR